MPKNYTSEEPVLCNLFNCFGTTEEEEKHTPTIVYAKPQNVNTTANTQQIQVTQASENSGRVKSPFHFTYVSNSNANIPHYPSNITRVQNRGQHQSPVNFTYNPFVKSPVNFRYISPESTQGHSTPQKTQITHHSPSSKESFQTPAKTNKYNPEHSPLDLLKSSGFNPNINLPNSTGWKNGNAFNPDLYNNPSSEVGSIQWGSSNNSTPSKGR